MALRHGRSGNSEISDRENVGEDSVRRPKEQWDERKRVNVEDARLKK